MLEKQNRELRDKLAKLEELAKGRSKVVISNLEAKIECEAEDHARVQEDGQTLERLAVADRGREKIERKLQRTSIYRLENLVQLYPCHSQNTY